MRRPGHEPSPAQVGAGELYLGLVILPRAGQVQQAVDALRPIDGLEVAKVEGHRIPAFARVAVGQDELLLERIRGLASVQGVDVAYAELVSEETG